MRVLSYIILAIILYPSLSFSSEIQFFNAEILGKNTSEQFNLIENLTKKKIDLINPKIIQLDIDDGIFSASSVYYDADKINFDDLVLQIDLKYPNSKVKRLSSAGDMRWRVEDKKFVISLSSQIEEGLLRVIYIRFMPTEKIMEHVEKTLKTMNNNCNK
jgi:hypothetical protein